MFLLAIKRSVYLWFDLYRKNVDYLCTLKEAFDVSKYQEPVVITGEE